MIIITVAFPYPAFVGFCAATIASNTPSFGWYKAAVVVGLEAFIQPRAVIYPTV